MRAEQLIHRSRIAVGAFFFSYGLCFSSWASRIPSIQQTLDLSDAALGGVLFALPVGSLISLPLSGYLVTKIGSKKVVLFASFIYTLTLVGIGFSPDIYILMSVLFMFGLAGNMFNISINTQAVGVEAKYDKNIMASFHGMWSFAGFAGAGIGALMIAKSIPPYIHYIFIWLIALIIICMSIKHLLKEDVNTDENRPVFSWPDRSLVVLGLIAFCSMMCEGAMFDWSGVYFKKIVNVKDDWVGLGYTAFMITMAGMRFLADRLTYRFGIRNILRFSGMLTTFGFALAIIFPLFITAIIGFLIIGVGVSAIIPLVFSAAGRSQRLSPGVAIASVSTLGFIGFLIGPPVIGLMAGAFDLRVSFVMLAFMGLLVTFLARRL